MFGLFKKLFGSNEEMENIIKSGAQIIDVRTTGEYANGHLKNSINIPLNELARKASTLKKDKAIVTCCASGMRSLSALNILKNAGFNEIYNGGSWMSLKKYER